MKLRWLTKIAAVFRPDEAAKTLTKAGVLLYSMVETFMWWFGGLRWPEIEDRMRERESSARGEKDFEIVLWCEHVYGVPVPLKAVSRWISNETIVQL